MVAAAGDWFLRWVFLLIAQAVVSFISNYFAMFEFVITFVKNHVSNTQDIYYLGTRI